jgi:bacterial/archaeal transporter family-2 protein
MALMWLIAAFLTGGLISIQTGINSQLSRQLGHAVQAAFVSFVIGTIALAAALPLLRIAFPSPSRVFGVSLPLLSGGLLGAVFVTAMIALGNRLSAAVLMSLVVAGQLVTSIALDHFGALGFPAHALSLPRLAGAALIVVGVLLIRRY